MLHKLEIELPGKVEMKGENETVAAAVVGGEVGNQCRIPEYHWLNAFWWDASQELGHTCWPHSFRMIMNLVRMTVCSEVVKRKAFPSSSPSLSSCRRIGKRERKSDASVNESGDASSHGSRMVVLFSSSNNWSFTFSFTNSSFSAAVWVMNPILLGMMKSS